MTQGDANWTQHEVSFCVWDNDKCAGMLRLIPLGCEFSDRADVVTIRRSVYGIYLRTRLERDTLECWADDFIAPSRFQELLRLFKGGPKPLEVSLHGDEGGIDIHFRWRQEGDVLVVGQMPSASYPLEHYLKEDPLFLRRRIEAVVRFEFLVEPKAICQLCTELESLLDYISRTEAHLS